MVVRRIIRSGILAKLAYDLPKVSGELVYKPRSTTLNLTNRCNAHCVICLEIDNQNKFMPFSLREAKGVLGRVAREITEENKGLLHLWGGEPFLDLRLLLGTMQKAARLGFRHIDVVTNGFWGKNIVNARKILQEMKRILGNAKFSLAISCDEFHQTQKGLELEYIANIMHLLDTEFADIKYRIISIASPRRDEVLTKLAKLLAEKKRVAVNFVGSAIWSFNKDGELPIMVINLAPSVAGGGKNCFFPINRLNPPDMVSNNPFLPHFSIDIDRQFYIRLEFGPAKILPMGDIHKRSIGRLVKRVQMDPIAVSLIKHGYSEIYDRLKKVRNFDVDAWVKQFYSRYDILQGLEADEPSIIL